MPRQGWWNRQARDKQANPSDITFFLFSREVVLQSAKFHCELINRKII
jgi:hypothetical protein